MSLPIASSGAASALPALNVHPHGHGHKKGLDSASDTGSDTAAQIPAGTGQNLFGGLLTSLEQVIGVQSANSPAAATAASAQTPAAASTAQSVGAAAKSLLGTVGSAISLFA
jgi:hypothetical protein